MRVRGRVAGSFISIVVQDRRGRGWEKRESDGTYQGSVHTA